MLIDTSIYTNLLVLENITTGEINFLNLLLALNKLLLMIILLSYAFRGRKV